MTEFQLISRYLTTAIGRLELVKTKLNSDILPQVIEDDENGSSERNRSTAQLLVIENQILDLELLIQEISKMPLIVIHQSEE